MHPFKLLGKIGACLLALSLGSGDVLAQSAEAKARLESAVSELGSLRERINTERAPLASELRKLETELIELRRTRDRLQRAQDSRTLDLATLEAQAKAHADEASYVANLLADYLNRLNASLSVSEVQSRQPPILLALNKGDNRELAMTERLSAQLDGMEAAFGRLESLIGGERVQGKAVLPNGRVVDGSFGLMGPVTYFASADGASAGIALRGPSEMPAVVEFDEKAMPAIAGFLKTGSGSLPVDTTQGRALAIATSEESLIEHFLKGGLWMYPIAFFGLLALVIAAIKLVQLITSKDVSDEDLTRVIGLVREEKIPEAIALAERIQGPGGRLLAQGVRNASCSKELLEEFLFEILLETKPRMERGTALIMLAASVAPLLGLLGTVTGMIETFKLLTLFGTGDAKSLSSGISQALITTEFGLVVAIPALILAALVGRMATAKLGNLERLSIAFSNAMAALREERPSEATA